VNGGCRSGHHVDRATGGHGIPGREAGLDMEIQLIESIGGYTAMANVL
jgi:hypothetical protein